MSNSRPSRKRRRHNKRDLHSYPEIRQLGLLEQLEQRTAPGSMLVVPFGAATRDFDNEVRDGFDLSDAAHPFDPFGGGLDETREPISTFAIATDAPRQATSFANTSQGPRPQLPGIETGNGTSVKVRGLPEDLIASTDTGFRDAPLLLTPPSMGGSGGGGAGGSAGGGGDWGGAGGLALTVLPPAFDSANAQSAAPVLAPSLLSQSGDLRSHADISGAAEVAGAQSTAAPADSDAKAAPSVTVHSSPESLPADAASAIAEVTGHGTPRQVMPLGFDNGLEHWDIEIIGGTDEGKGSVTVGSAILEEGNSFEVAIEQTFTVPEDPVSLDFVYEAFFDTTDPDFINDAFEVSLKDEDGNVLVHPFAESRDSYFNLTEELPASLGQQVTMQQVTGGTRVSVDISDLFEQSEATVRFRLVNNDSDTETTVRIKSVEVISGASQVDPELEIQPPSVVGCGLPQQYLFNVTQPGSYRYEIDWNGDGQAEQTILDDEQLSIERAVTTPGVSQIRAIVTDLETGQQTDSTAESLVAPAAIVDGDLVVCGTLATDRIIFSEGQHAGDILVRRNSDQLGPFQPTGHLIAFGLDGSDQIVLSGATALPARLYGGPGDDYLASSVGDDFLSGGPGRDRLLGGDGNNRLEGGDDDDRLATRDGEDVLLGGRGRDILHGGGGDDLIDAGPDDDQAAGGDGFDVLIGGPGNDTLNGERGDDLVLGGPGDDFLIGHDGRDILFGSSGNDTLRGGYGDDILVAAPSLHDADLEAVSAFRAEWLSTSVAGQRVANIRSGAGNTAGHSLTASEGFVRGDVRNTLEGEDGSDWIIASASDRIWNRRPDDLLDLHPDPLPVAAGSKFYVADAEAGASFQYTAGGTGNGGFALASGPGDPRGVTSNAAGDRFWFVDGPTGQVSVQSADGGLVGTWKALGVSAAEGIATDGEDMWIVDAASNWLLHYPNAATLTSGWSDPDLVFSLDAANASPTGLATDGSTLWVVDDLADSVFVYGVDGSFQGHWQLDTANANPSGITNDPTGTSESLWVVDRLASIVHEYADATAITSGALMSNGTFALSDRNVNPQGIADPSVVSTTPRLTVTSPKEGRAFPSGQQILITGQAEAFQLPRSEPSPFDSKIYGLKSNGEFNTELSGPPTHLFEFRNDGSGFHDRGPVTLGGNAIDVDGLAVSQRFGLVAFQVSKGDSNLISIDQVTAQATSLGLGYPGRDIRGAAFDIHGTLWAIDSASQELLAIDLTTQEILQSIELGPTDLDLDLHGLDMAVSAEGTMYVAGWVTAGGTGFYILDVTNGDLHLAHVDREPRLDDRTQPFVVGLAFSNGPGQQELFGYDVNGPEDVFAYRPDEFFGRSTVLANVPPAFNAGRGDLASLPVNRYPENEITRVLVNGSAADVLDASATFFSQVTVTPGQNTIVVKASDRLGQTATTTLNVEGTSAYRGDIDFSLLSDVSASFLAKYGRTSFNEDTDVLFADVAIRNSGQYLSDAPLVVGVTNISEPTVLVRESDGMTPEGLPYFDLSPLVANGTLEPGELTFERTLAFYNPERTQFTYDLVFLGKLNEAPQITTVPDIEAIVDRDYVYDVDAIDPDENELTYTLITAPAGMTMDSASGAIRWVPGASDVGLHDVTVLVEDGRGGSAQQRYVLSVIEPPPNRPPYFTSVPVVETIPGATYSYDADASDPDGDVLDYTVLNGPDGLSVASTTGVVVWGPTSDQIGTYDVVLGVSDGRGGTAEQSYTIRIAPHPANHPPVIVTDPVTSASSNEAYVYDVDAIDPDPDPLKYLLTEGPDGMTIDPVSGVLEWMPLELPETAAAHVTVRVEDGRGGFDEQSFTIDVFTPSGELRGTKFNDLNGNGGQDVGVEFLVNTTTETPASVFGQDHVASSVDGYSIVVWQSDGQDGSGSGVYGQRFDSLGQPLGGEFRLSDTTTGDQRQPSVATMPDGGFVARWYGNGPGDDSGIFARRFDSAGNPLGIEFLVNTTTAGDQTQGSIAASPDGGFTIIFSSRHLGDLSTFGQRFSADGTPVGDEFLVFRASQTHTIKYFSDGRFAVTGRADVPGESGAAAWLRIFDADGVQRTPDIRINENTLLDSVVAGGISIADDDRLFVLFAPVSLNEGYYGRFFDGQGSPISEEFLIDSNAGSRLAGTSEWLSENEVIVGLSKRGLDSNSDAVFARTVRADELRISEPILINQTQFGAQNGVDVANTGEGQVLFVWQGNGIGDTQGVFGRRYPVEDEPGLADWVVFLDENHDAMRDDGEPWTTTDAEGSYSFSGLAPGTYYVAEEQQPGWYQTTPSTSHHIVQITENGEVMSGIDFGNREAYGEIRGNVFNDLNESGVRDLATTLLVSNSDIIRYNASNGAYLDTLVQSQLHGRIYGYAAGTDGILYAVDYDRGRILRFDAETGEFIDVLASDSRITLGVYVAIGEDGHLLVTNNNKNLPVMKFDRLTGQFLGDFIPIGRGGLVAAGRVVLGPDGNLYVQSIRHGDRILRYDATDGQFIDTFAILPSHRSDYLSGYGNPGMAFGPDGDLYLCDQGDLSAPAPGHSVMRFDGETGEYKDDFVATRSGGLLSPRGLEWDSDGNLLVSSSYSDEVLRYDGGTGAFIDRFIGSDSLRGPWQLENAGTREPVLPDWRVYLDINGNGRWEVEEPLAVTDSAGNYRFDRLAPRDYTVRLEVAPNWEATIPSDGHIQVGVPAGGIVDDVGLGVRQVRQAARGEVRGVVYNDVNVNGQLDDDEYLAKIDAPAYVYVDDNANGRRDEGEQYAIIAGTQPTGADSFVIPDLPPGVHEIAIEAAQGWYQTSYAGASAVPPLLAVGKDEVTGLSQLYRLEDLAEQPRAILVGETQGAFRDLAVDPVTGSAYAITGSDVYSVDVSTGQAQLIGFTGVNGLTALAHSRGTLYAMSSQGTYLYRINTATGEASVVFDTGYVTSGDLAVDVEGRFYLTTGSHLVRLDLARSNATLIGRHGNGGFVGLAIDFNGQLLGLRDVPTGGTELYKIDNWTGAAELIGEVGLGIEAAGLAFDAARIVPNAALRTYRVSITGNESVRNVNFGLNFGVNKDPIIESAPTRSARIEGLYRYDAAADDPDNDPVTFDLLVKPDGMAVQPSTGIVVWTPTANQVGTHDVILRVQDGRGGLDLQSFQIEVTSANSGPAITSVPRGPAVVDLPYVYQVRAQDADGDPLSYRLDASPDGMSIDSSTGLVTWTPAASQVGSHHVEITVSDDQGASTTQLFDLPVVSSAPNDAPAINSTPRTQIRIGDTYRYEVLASDSNGDPLSYQLTVQPDGMTIDSAGLVTWTPTQAQFGTHAVEVRVEDGRGGSATQGFTIGVVSQGSNRPPAITSTPTLAATVERQYAYNLVGTDPDGDPLRWSLDLGPAGMSVDPGTGTVRWTPTFDQLGQNAVVVRVVDGQGGFATQSYAVTVRSFNVPPNIVSAPPTVAWIDEPYTYAVRAVDPEGDVLAFQLTASPAGMAIDGQAGVISWTPGITQLGSHDVTVLVDDHQGGTARQTYTVVVSDGESNEPPVITSTPPFVATVEQPYQYPITAVDPEGETPTYLLLAGPDGMVVDPATGVLSWTPGLDQLGGHSVTVAAVDSLGQGGTQTYTLVVLDANQNPTITSQPIQVVTAGLHYGYDVRASDPDGDPIRYELAMAPDGMTIDQLGRITWSPGIVDIGTHRVVVEVSDNRGGFVAQNYDLAVLADTQSPRIELLVSQNPANLGSLVTFLVTATDNVGVVSKTLSINGNQVPLDAMGRVTLLAEPVGSYEIRATASDAAGRVSAATTTLLVIDTSDVEAPTVRLDSPADGDIVSAPIDVIGTADDANLLFYTVAVAPLAGGEFQEMFRSTTAVVDGVLGRLDPSTLANGTYRLRLSATDSGGNTAEIENVIEVAGDLKIGNFTLSFTDLAIPVSGIPITVTRTYDSLNSGAQDELGYGWRLEFRDTDLRTSLLPSGFEEFGIYTPFRVGARVYVTAPGGRREGFTFAPRLAPGFAGSVLGLREPAFTPDAGVTSRLSVPNYQLIQNEFGEFFGLVSGGSLAYNPQDDLNFGGVYYLTTADGLAYEIDANTGDLLRVADPNSNTLTFSDASIDSSTGQRITFDRDPRGRIIAVTDPERNQVQYQYDQAGDLVAVTDRDGNVTTFEYQEPARAHFLTSVIDPLGRTGVRTEYDDQGRLIRLIDVDGNPVQLVHDPDNFVETVVDALGHPTIFEYDQRGNVVTETNALGETTLRTYDLNNFMLSETDPLGNTTSFTYNGNGDVLTETDPLGNTTIFTYQSFRAGELLARLRDPRPFTRLGTTTDPLGNTTTNGYDGAGNLLSTTDALGNVTSFTYDSTGNQTSITDAAGNVTAFQYDATGNLARQTDSLGNVAVFTYDANGNQLTETTTLTTPAGERTLVTRTEYDASGRPTRVTDAEGHVTVTEYDELGNQSATVDALGRRTEFRYDERGQMVGLDSADGTSTSINYDVLGRRASSTDRAGRITRFEYDAVGRLTATIFPDDTPNDNTDNPRTRTEYDAAGRVTAQIDELGNRTEFEYDAAGRQTLVRDALGNETTTVYDAAGRSISTTDALTRTTQFVYDALGRQMETVFADNTNTATSYDALGRVVAQTDQAGRVTGFEYDALGRLTAVVDALDQRTEYEYDEAGNLIVQRDANGHETHFEYDGLGRRLATTLPLGQRSTTQYDAVGNVSSSTDFNGDTISFRYDVNNRLAAKEFPDGSSVTYTYTVTGQRETVIDDRGTTSYEYDERDRLLSRTDPDGRQITYTYDAAGNRTSLTTPSGNTSYTFDPLNRMETVTDPDGGIITYSYDAVGNLVRTDLPNGTWETREYDELNRLEYLVNASDSGVISSYRYQLDPVGNRTQVVEHDGRTVDYGYDDLYRLTSERITDATNGNRQIDYTYDPVGNRLTRDDSLEGVTTYTYDDNDRLLTETLAGDVTRYEYDDNGNTISRTSATDQVFYDWDYDNRLTSVDTDGDGTPDVTYDYDADGTRVSSTVAGEETRYLIDANRPYAQVLEEYTPGGVIKASYVHGLDLISQNRTEDGGVTYQKSFYYVDGLGSTRALTDATGIVTDTYIYDAFGRTIGQVGSTGNVYLFVGEQRDLATGLDYLRARWLNPSVGRFHGMDPFDGVMQSPMSLHSFLYAHGDPVNNRDPRGKFVEFLALGIANTVMEEIAEFFKSNQRRYREGTAAAEKWKQAQPGPLALGAFVKSYFPEARFDLSSERRVFRPGGGRSLHASGRAVDIGLTAADPVQGFIGDRLLSLFVDKATSLGLAQVIWREQIWTLENANAGIRQYTPNLQYYRNIPGADPYHIRHIHIGFTVRGSQRTSFSSLSGDLARIRNEVDQFFFDFA